MTFILIIIIITVYPLKSGVLVGAPPEVHGFHHPDTVPSAAT